MKFYNLVFVLLTFLFLSTKAQSANYYWIGNTGNWNDGNHWSLTSGGAAAAAVPTAADSVFFDALSFTIPGQTVTVNVGYFKAMKWSNILATQTLLLDSLNATNTGTLYGYGDITLHANVKVRRVEMSCSFIFGNAGIIRANSANIDANFRLNMATTAETVSLGTDLVMSDTSSVILLQGGFNTQSLKLVTGTFRTLNNPAGISDTRSLTLGSSNVHIVRIFQSDSDAQFTLNAGTSNVYIGDTVQIIPDTLSYVNGLLTSGSTFYNVTLNFQKVKYGTLFADQKVTGANTFNKLKIVAGSRVQFANAVTQIVTDSLLILGTCADSIYILSDGAGQFTFNKPNTKVKVQCVRMEDCNISSAQTAYYSTNVTNNSANWTFSTLSPIAADFTSSSPDCFGSTTTFTPTATVPSGEFYSFSWLYNDGTTTSLTSDQFVATNSSTLSFTQPVGTSANDTVIIASWTEVSDPSSLFYPAVGPGTAYPSPNGQNMVFNFNIDLDFNLNNTSGADAYLVDMNNNYYQVKYKYKPKIVVYKNGAPYGSVPLISNNFVYKEDTLANGTHIPVPNGINLLKDTTVSVSININNLQPTDKLTFRAAVAVTYDGYPAQPRWKNAYSAIAPDVTVGYQMVFNSLTMTATPTSNYVTGTNSHVFNDRGDFNVVLIATNTSNMCTDTITHPVNIYGPISYLATSQLDTTICTGESVTFGATSNTAGALFQFFINGVSQGAASTQDTLITSTLTNNAIVTVQTTAGGCTSVNDPDYQFVVNPLPTFTVTDNDADNTICTGTLVTFAASPTGTGNQYRYKKNTTFVTAYNTVGTWSSSTLVNGDVVKTFAKSAQGCVDSISNTYIVLPLPTITLTENSLDYIICAGDAVTFTAGGAGASGLYEFFVNGVSQGAASTTTTFTTSSLTNGAVVSVKGTTASGCMSTSSTTFTYTVAPLPAVSLSVNPGTTVCSGTNVVVNASGASLYQFFVNSTSQGAASATSSISSSSYANNTTFYVIGTTGGCSSTSSITTLTVNTSPATVLTSSDADNSICAGTSVTFTGTGASTYQFLINGVAQGAFSATNTFTSTTLSNGNVVSVIGQSNGCFVSQQLTMTVLNNPNVLLFSSEADNTICAGAPITFTGANASQYQLYVNGTSVAGPQASATFTNPTLSTGVNSVYVIGTSGNGCTGQSSPISTTVINNPTVTISSSDADNTICAGQSVTFNGNGASMYQFFVGGTAQGSMSATSTFTTTGLTNGQTVSVVGSTSGCTGTSTNITMTVNPVPGVTLSSSDADNSFCQNDPVVFTASGATSYQFFVNGVSQGAPSATTTLNASSFGVGTYPVSVTGTQTGCSSTSAVTVTVNSLPTTSISSSDADNTICAGTPVTYTATGGSMYLFSINGTPQGTANPLSTYTSSTLTNGNVISAQVITPQGCSASASMSPLTVNALPTTGLTSSDADQIICIGSGVTFTASGASLYEFFVNGTSQGAPSSTSTFTTTGLNNGATVTVAGTTNNCTSSSPALNFTVYGPPAVQLFNNGQTTLCTGQGVNLLANGASLYQFTVNGIPVGAFSPTATFTNAVNNGDVVSVIGQSNGCNNTSGTSYTFTVNAYPSLSTTSSDADNVICADDLVTFTASGAPTYDFELNGNSVQTGATNTYSTSTLEQGDVVTITGYNGNCGSTPATYTFTVNSLNLGITATPGTMICEGENVTFNVTGADQYEFFINGVSQGSPSGVNTLSSTTLNDNDEITFNGYSSSTGCTQAYGSYLLMDVMTSPVFSTSGGPDFCQGDSIIMTSNLSTGNQWYLNGSPIVGATDTFYVAYTSGTYSLENNQGGNGELWSKGLNAQGIFGDGSNLNSFEPVAAQGGVQFDEISSGSGFMVGVTTAGAVYSWGENSSGQLGNGTFTSSNIPAAIASLSNIKTVATTSNSVMAVNTTGGVYVWGNNAVGQLATGNTSVINFPYLNPALSNVDTVAAGRSHVILLKTDGTVWTAGNNDYGQLGTGNLTGSLSAVQVAGLANIVAVGAGEYSSFAINSTGQLYAWGNNGSGQLGLGDINNRLTPALSGLKNIVHAEGGATHSVFLNSEDELYTSGDNTYGQLGTGNNNPSVDPVKALISGVKQVSANEYSTLMLRNDQSVFGCGTNVENQLTSVMISGYSTPLHLSEVHGVTFVEAASTSSHFVYGLSSQCTSVSVTLNMLPVPTVTISESNGVLSTIAGVSYQWYFNGSPVFEGTSQSFTPLEAGTYSVEVTFANGCSGTSADYLFGTSGLAEDQLALSIYPNPSFGVFNVKINVASANYSIDIRDLSGRVIEESLHFEDGMIQIDLTRLAAGVYVIELKEGSTTLSRHQVIKNN